MLNKRYILVYSDLEAIMALYELKVFDDGECATRKVLQCPPYQTNMFFYSQNKLKEYLESFLYIRWPITEVLDATESARD